MSEQRDLSDLPAIARDADLLDRLSRGESVSDPAVRLLAALRDAAPPPRMVPTVVRPVVAAERSGSGRRTRRRWRACLILALTAAIPSTGVAAAAAHPGNPLYRIHKVLLGPTADDPSVPARLLDRADREAADAATDDRSRAASHVARGLKLIEQARRHLPHLHAEDAARLADRADGVATHLGAATRTTPSASPLDRCPPAPVRAAVRPAAAPDRAARPPAHRAAASRRDATRSGPARRARPGPSPATRVLQRSRCGCGAPARTSAPRPEGRQRPISTQRKAVPVDSC